MRVLITLIFTIICPTIAFLQSEKAFIAYTDADGVMPGQPFEVTFELKNVRIRSFDPPDFGSLEVLRGPSVTNSMQVINGRKSSSRTYAFTLAAPHAGRFAIPPARANTEEGIMRSNSIEMVVQPVAEGEKVQSGDIILKIVPSDSQVYVGEQLTLDYILFFQQAVERIYTSNELDFSGFYREKDKINQYARSVQRTSVNGKPYSKKIIQRDILFGQQSGTYEMGPLFCEVEVLDENDRSPFSFFRNTIRKKVVASPISIDVVPLPDSLPKNFSGGVGSYHMETQIRKRQVTIGEAAEIWVKIEGNGDPNILDAPTLSTVGNARIFDPQLIHESKEEVQGKLNYIRSWNYLVVPEEEGLFSIQAKFVYLDAERNAIDTLVSPNLEIWARPTTADTSKVDITEDNGTSKGSDFWVYLIAGSLLVGFATALIIRFGKSKSNSKKPIQNIQTLISLLRKEKQATKPDLSGIKKGIDSIANDPLLPDGVKDRLISLKKELERYQFSQEKDPGRIQELLDKLITELRKAESELE